VNGGMSGNHRGPVGAALDVQIRRRPLAESVLRLIWHEKETTRAEIARCMDLSRSTVTEIVDGLLRTGLVAEVGAGRSSGGRRPIVLEFQDQARVILGVDVGATHVSAALVDLRGRVLAWKGQKHPVRTDPEGSRRLVFKLCDECLAEWGGGNERLLRIGIAVPSPVDPLNPKWLSEVVIPAWQGESGLEKVQERYGVPVHVDNDANLGALAEHWWGAGRGVSDLIFIKMAHGIGAGYILNGGIYRGASGVAGEFGHIPIDPSGEKCVCGLHGCLTTFVSTPALSARAAALAGTYPESPLHGQEVNLVAIGRAAHAGDALATRLVEEVAHYLSLAIAGWFNLMNPQLVVLGGDLVDLGETILPALREKVASTTLVTSAVADIKMSELGAQTIAIGAATLALEDVLSTPDLAPAPGDTP
jgi:predicted NBD/HSP70 family sugar kinase